MRFRPPPLTISLEIRWMLLRAFGPEGAPFPGALDAEKALRLARRFEVSARIAARQGRERLAAEMGPEAAAGFLRDRTAAAASGLRLMAAVRQVAEAAASLGVPLAVLKFAALEGTGLLAGGSRGACDIDVLAPGGRAEDLQRALAGAGYRVSGMPGMEHQLPPLSAPSGAVVEIHRHLPGVRIGGGASATFEALDREGLLAPLPDQPGRCSAPVPEVQAAHALVHGMGQHGYWPASYSLLKMVADLLDLGVEALTPRALAWTARDVPAFEAEAVRRLCLRLAAGEGLEGWDGPEEILLRHMLAGRLDSEYGRALRLGLFQPVPSDRPRPLQLARTLLDAVFLTDAQIVAVYGPPRTRLGYLGRRIARPFDLLWRLGSYGLARLRR